ncbi:MAG TPA: hypothetical protein VE035_16990 [Puia sp.]|nr:hypothetical protein [Puia sp.]
MEKRIKYGGSFLLLLLAGMALYVYESRLSRVTPTLIREAETRITARELVRSFDSSEALSSRKFLYKVLSVRGVVQMIRKNEQGDYIIDLGAGVKAGGDPAGRPVSVSCSLDSIYNSLPMNLNAGDSTTIRGICAGHFINVLMVQCIIEK